MAVYFFDTSALVKRYAREAGTKWVQSLTDPAAGNDIYIARITGAEAVAAIRLKVRNRETSEVDARRGIADFKRDFTDQDQLVEITEPIVERAMTLIENHKLRGYDGVQLAAAVEINDQLLAIGMPMAGVPALTIVSVDKEINTAAGAEHLLIENPESYPHTDDKKP